MTSKKVECEPDLEITNRDIDTIMQKHVLETEKPKLFKTSILTADDHAKIIPFGDIHYGHKSCNYNMLNIVLKWMYNTPNVYVVGMGDYLESSVADSPGLFDQKIYLDEQLPDMIDLLQPLVEEKRLIGLLEGNHEHRVKRLTGLDVTKLMCKMLKIPYLETGALHLISVRTNGSRDYEKYTMYTTHGASMAQMPQTKILACMNLSRIADAEIYCLSEDTEVLTAGGWKTMNDISMKDDIFNFNIETRQIEKDIIKNIIIKHSPGDLVHFTGKSIDILVTPEHRILYWNPASISNINLLNNKNPNPSLIINQASELAKRESPFFLPVAGEYIGKQVNLSDEFIELCGWLISEGNFCKGQTKTHNKFVKTSHYKGVCWDDRRKSKWMACIRINNKNVRKRFEKEENAALWYDEQQRKIGGNIFNFPLIGEQQYSSDTRLHNGIRLFQSIKHQQWCNRIEYLLNKLNYKYTKTIRAMKGHKFGNTKYCSTADYVIYYIPAKFGKEIRRYISNKNIQPWMFDLNIKQTQMLLNGLIDGDGHRHNNTSSTYYSNNIDLLDKLQALLILKNIRTSLHIKDRHRYLNITTRTNKAEISPRDVKYEKYSGKKVWCLETSNGTLVIRRNGKVAIVGNCLGHVHSLFHQKIERYTMNDHSNGIIKRSTHYVLTGSYLNYWGTYSQAKSMMPSGDAGSPKINLHTKEHRITVSL
jgi:hypothetical protein